LDPAVTPVSSTSLPKREFFVRRRKYEGRCWLVKKTSFYEIDPVVEHVWLNCNGDVPVRAIAETIEAELGMSADTAAMAARNSVNLLLSLGLVHIEVQ
jgi:hypothetical protein